MGLTLALRVLALTLVALIASQSILLAYAERAVDPYEALYNWLKKNLVVVGLTPYRGVNYPTIGEYREPNVITQTESGETIQMNYREYLNKLMEGKINLQAKVQVSKDTYKNVTIKLNLDPVFLTWGTLFTSSKPNRYDASDPSRPIPPYLSPSHIYRYDVFSAYLSDPSYLYSYITFTNGSKLKLPKGENLILALSFKDLDVSNIISKALGGGRSVGKSIDLEQILSKAPIDDPYFGVILVEWSVKGRSGNLYKVGKGVYETLKPYTLKATYFLPRGGIGDVEVTGSDVIPIGMREYDPRFQSEFHYIPYNVNIFRPIGPPLDSVQSLVNLNIAPEIAFLASSAMYVIKPDVYSGGDRVEVVLSDLRGRFRLAIGIDIEVGEEIFKIEGTYTFTTSKVSQKADWKRWDTDIVRLFKNPYGVIDYGPLWVPPIWREYKESQSHTWSVRVEKIGYDEHGSLRLKIRVNYAHIGYEQARTNDSSGFYIYRVKKSIFMVSPEFIHAYYSRVYNSVGVSEIEVAIGGYTLNPAPPLGIITIPQAEFKTSYENLISIKPTYKVPIDIVYHRVDDSRRFTVTNENVTLTYMGHYVDSISRLARILIYNDGNSLRVGLSLFGEYPFKGEMSRATITNEDLIASSTGLVNTPKVTIIREVIFKTVQHEIVNATRRLGPVLFDILATKSLVNFVIPALSPVGPTPFHGGAFTSFYEHGYTPTYAIQLWRSSEKEAPGAVGPLTLTVRAYEPEDYMISGRKGLLEARLYGDKVEGVQVELEAKLTMLFTKEGKPYNKSLEIAVEPRQARTDGDGRALFIITIPSIDELKAKLELSEEELKQTQIANIAFLKVKAKAGDLEAYTMILVTIAGVYAKINIWDIGIPIPQNLWGNETITGYIWEKYIKHYYKEKTTEVFIEKYFRPKDSDLKVEVYIESLDGEVKTTITGTKLLKAGSGGELKPGKEYKVSYKMIYKGKVVLEAVDVAKFKLGNESEGLEVVDVNVYIPASLYLKYTELKQILEGTVYHKYTIPLGDPALVLTIIPIMPVVEDIARELGIKITIDDWAYLKPKIKIPDWGEKGTELEVFNKITYADEKFNLTLEALDNPKSYWSKMAKLTIIMAETIRTYRYTLSTTKALAVVVSLIASLSITKEGLYTWKQKKDDMLKETAKRWGSLVEKTPAPLKKEVIKKEWVKYIKTAKVTLLVSEATTLTLRAVMPVIQPIIQDLLSKIGVKADDEALVISAYIAAIFKITRFAFVAAQGFGDLVADTGFEILFQLLLLIIAHTVNSITNLLVQGAIDTEVKPKEGMSRWASREEARGALSASDNISAAEKVFYDVANAYILGETIVQLALSILRGADGIKEILTSGKSELKIPDFIAKLLKMPINVQIKEGGKEKEITYKTKDVITKLYLSLAAALIVDTLVKPIWLFAFKAALVGDKKSPITQMGLTEFVPVLTGMIQGIAPLMAFVLTATEVNVKVEGPAYSGGKTTISLSTPGDVDLDNLRASLGAIRDLKPRVVESLQLSTYDVEVLIRLSQSIDTALKTITRLSHRTQDLNIKMAYIEHQSTLQTLTSYLEDMLSTFIAQPGLRPTEDHVEAVGDLIDLITSTLESSINTTITAMKANALSNRVEEPVVFIEGVSTTPEGWIEVSIANVGDVSASVKLNVVESNVLSSYSSEVVVGARSVETAVLKPQVKRDTRIASVVLELVVNNVLNTYNVSLVFEPSVNLEVYGDKAVVYNGLVEFSDGKFRVSNLTFISILVNSSDGRFLLYLDGSPVRTGLIRFGNATLVSASFTKPITGVLEIKTVDSRTEIVRGSGVLETNLGVSIESDSPVEAKIEMLKDNPYPEAGLSGGGNTVVYSIDVRGDKPVKVIVNLDVLGVSDVSKVKIYKYSSTREAYVEIEDYTIDSKSRTITFTLKPGDPVIAITSKPVTPGGEGAKIVYTTGNVRPPRSPEFQGGVGVEEAGRSLWFYVALVAIAVVAAFVALIALARFRRRS